MTGASHILVVEDDEIVTGLIDHILTQNGFRVTAIGDGESAWSALCADHDFAAILLDRGLPELDGMALLARIKADAKLQHIPVVMETARDDTASIREGINAGAYYYLTKPLNVPLLLSVIDAAIKQHQEFVAMQTAIHETRLTLSYLKSGIFCCRTLTQASELAVGLAHLCPDPGRVALGLQELIFNAIEHGNLAISYAEKTQLMIAGKWHEEVLHRGSDLRYRDRQVTIHLTNRTDSVSITISDEGKGFDWQQYLGFSPERAFDPHGRGIAMARMTSFDSLEYSGNGNTVTVSVALPADSQQKN